MTIHKGLAIATPKGETSVVAAPVNPDDGGRAALEEAVARVGDRWSLLVVDALLGGSQRFGELSERVRGVSPNVLSRRLTDLEAAGVLTAEPYSQRPLRHEYRLTPLGRDLAAALAALAAWGERAAEAGASALDDAPVRARSDDGLAVADHDLVDRDAPATDGAELDAADLTGDDDIHYA